jgi:ribosomal protein L16 Arg81 hydroxylase
VQAYATPGGFRSFGWHYDCEEVFIVQTSGTKQFSLRRNTVNPRPTLDAMPADMHFERETSAPVIETTLIAGDWIYIPRGWWHIGRGVEDALSLSIGVLAEEARGAREPVGRSAVRPRA